MPINRGMDKEDVAHIYNGILLSHKRTKYCLRSNMDGPRDCHSDLSPAAKDEGTNELIYRREVESWM